MAINNLAIFPKTAVVNGAGTFITAVTGANTATDGTGTVNTIYTAGIQSYVDGVEFAHAGSNVATVARVFMNNGSTNATAANNILIGEVTIGANTLSQTASSIRYSILLKRNIPTGYKLNFTIGTAVAAGILGIAYGMDY